MNDEEPPRAPRAAAGFGRFRVQGSGFGVRGVQVQGFGAQGCRQGQGPVRARSKAGVIVGDAVALRVL